MKSSVVKVTQKHSTLYNLTFKSQTFRRKMQCSIICYCYLGSTDFMYIYHIYLA